MSLLQTLVKSVDSLNQKVEQSFSNSSGIPIVQSVNYAQPLIEKVPMAFPESDGGSIAGLFSTLAAEDELHQEDVAIRGSLSFEGHPAEPVNYLPLFDSWISSEVQPYQQLAAENQNSDFAPLSAMQLDALPLKETSMKTVSFNPDETIICNDCEWVEDDYGESIGLIVEFQNMSLFQSQMGSLISSIPYL